MKQTTLIAIVAVAALAVGAAVYTTQHKNAERATEQGAGAAMFPDLASRAGAATSISIDHQGQTLTFLKESGLKESGRWVLQQSDGYAADGGKLNGLIAHLIQARKVEAKTVRPENYPLIQVEDPDADNAKSVLITLTDDTGQSLASLILGKPGQQLGPNRPTAYARIPGEAQAWLLETTLSVDTEAKDWLATTLTNVDMKRIARVRVLPVEDGEVIAERERPADPDLALRTVPAGKEPRGKYTINQLGFTFETLSFDAVRKDAGEPATTRTVVETFDGLRIVAAQIDIDGAPWWRFTAEADVAPVAPGDGDTALKPADAVAEELKSIRAATEGWLFRLPDYKNRQLTAKLSDLVKDIEPVEPAAPESGATGSAN